MYQKSLIKLRLAAKQLGLHFYSAEVHEYSFPCLIIDDFASSQISRMPSAYEVLFKGRLIVRGYSQQHLHDIFYNLKVGLPSNIVKASLGKGSAGLVEMVLTIRFMEEEGGE